jgi:hypothetical protein
MTNKQTVTTKLFMAHPTAMNAVAIAIGAVHSSYA